MVNPFQPRVADRIVIRSALATSTRAVTWTVVAVPLVGVILTSLPWIEPSFVSDRLLISALLSAALVAIYCSFRIKLEIEPQGIAFCNGFRTRSFAWADINAVGIVTVRVA
jgi:hypothetical protein